MNKKLDHWKLKWTVEVKNEQKIGLLKVEVKIEQKVGSLTVEVKDEQKNWAIESWSWSENWTIESWSENFGLLTVEVKMNKKMDYWKLKWKMNKRSDY